MSHLNGKLKQLVQSLQGREFDPHYLGFFECFNRQLFFEAHEVLEALWLVERGRPKARFYQGLIQLAGAFVHVQKNRPGPATALFRLARSNLGGYPGLYLGLDLGRVSLQIDAWVASLETGAHPASLLASHQLPAPVLAAIVLTPPLCDTAENNNSRL